MKLLLAALAVTLSGCGLGSYTVRTTDDAIRIVKEAYGSGCQYTRVSGSAAPWADVQARAVTISTTGKGSNIKDCMAQIPPEARAMLGIEQLPIGVMAERSILRADPAGCASSLAEHMRRSPDERRAWECICGGVCK